MSAWPVCLRGLRVGGPFALMLLAAGMGTGRLAAQEEPWRYAAGPLTCVAYGLSVRSTVRTARGSAERTEHAGWDGRVLVAAESGLDGSVAVVGWYEQLEIWSETPEGRVAPSTGGLIEGRFRGRLDSSGTYRREAVPFMPEGVAMIADLSTTMDELFPPLPSGPLAPGQSSIDSLGWQFDRLSDTTWNMMPATRLRLLHRDSSYVQADFGRGQLVEGTSIEVEHGRVVWVDASGPVLWTRRIATTVSFPAATLTPEAVVTHIDQRRRVERLAVPEASRCPGQ